MLEVDVTNQLHKRITPYELSDTQDIYKDFPLDVFEKWMNNEAKQQKAAKCWAHKQNKRRMKKYLQDLATKTQSQY